MKYSLTLLPLVAILALGCRAPRTQVVGDSLVLAGTEPGNLLYPNVDPSRGVIVRSTYLATKDSITYTEGADYTLDPRNGTLARTPNSRIPDFTKNVLYGKKNFNHGQFPGFGNLPFTTYVTYRTTAPAITVPPTDASPYLQRTIQKLRAGQPVKIIAFGDSITAGGDASTPDLQYPALFAAHLRKLYPNCPITLENGATGGDTTRNGLARLKEKVLTRSPDLVLVAFGMNDHNVPAGGGVPIPEFESNLVQIVSAVRKETESECILLSAFDPNSEWMFGTHNMDQYAQATQRAAAQTHSAYADVYALWQKVLARKDAPSLLGNNINHPNDFGHHLYLQALQSLKF